MTSEISSPVQLQPGTWKQAIREVLERVIAEKGQVLFCVTGKSGSGKSTLGKQIRKQGLPGISRRDIAVIDDGILAVPLLAVFTRRIKSKTRERDNLVPFRHFTQNKKVVIYVNVTPHQRLDRCDVALRLRCPEEVRRVRLINREKLGEERFKRTLNASDEVSIQADHVFDLCLVESHDRAPVDEAVGSVAHAAAS